MRLAIIGLDGAVPDLVFNKWRQNLPNISSLIELGAYGPLTSTHPPITVPAWVSMMSGKDPGQLGLYGFRNRRDNSYGNYAISNSRLLKCDRIWDILSQGGEKVCLLGVPVTYPPMPVNGYVVSDFLTPSTRSEYTYPIELKEEVEKMAGGYVLDVEDFRTDDKELLLNRIYEKTRKHFLVGKHLITSRPWNFFMLVEMGIDRIHHGFWSFMDPEHRNYRPGNKYETAIKEYYSYCDQEIGELISLLPRETLVIVVSDHGAKKMDGGFCLNEWLINAGYLAVRDYPSRVTPLNKLEINWSKTVAWGEGGYFGRVFLNVRGREPNGVVRPEDYEGVRSNLIEKIESIDDPKGRSLNNRAYRPEDLYKEVTGVPPDLIVYFGDLNWRSVGSVGMGSLYTFTNDTGPDEANHDWDGIFILNESGCDLGNIEPGCKQALSIYDIAPTVLDLFGYDYGDKFIGKSLVQNKNNIDL